MKALMLEIFADAYELSLDAQVLARLEGGPMALLAGAGGRLRDVDIEMAIERAEEWLMPSSKSFQKLELQVRYTTGRLRDRIGGPALLAPEEVERAFSGMVDDVRFNRTLGRGFVADLVLLRELVHHGGLSRVVLG